MAQRQSLTKTLFGPQGPQGQKGDRGADGSGIEAVTAVKVSAYSAVAGDVVQADPSSAGFNVTLPSAASYPRQMVYVKFVGSSSNVVTVVPSGGDTVDLGVSFPVDQLAECVGFLSDGSNNWVLLSDASAAVLASATPQAVGTATAGVATAASRSDHVHAHGAQASDGAMHAVATTSVAGFESAADKTKLDSLSIGFSSISAMRAGAVAANGAVAQLAGYYAAGDGGGGLFVYSTASTATDDGGAVIKPTVVGGGAGRWLRDLSDGIYNVRFWGAQPTDIGTNFDSLFAFDAAMLAMGPAYAFTDASYTGQKLIIPPSPGGYPDTFYYLSDQFNVTRNCEIWGVAATGGSVGGGTKLKFPLGKRGVVFMSYLDGTGQRSDGASIHNCQVFSTFPGDVATTAVWRAGHAYSLGDIIVPRYSSNRYGYAYKCTTAGTSDSTEPDFPGQILGGSEAADDYDDATYSDGGVTWTTVQLHGIDVRSNFVQIEGCYVHHWPGNGINCHGATGEDTYNLATADIAQIRAGSTRYCGGSGVSFAGHDGNAGYVLGVSSTQNIGWGFRDDSVLGQLFLSCHSDNNARGSYAVGRAIDCYSEGGVLQYVSGMHWTGGIPGRFSNDFQKTWTALDATIVVGDTRVPTTPNGYQFVALSTGTTGASEPTWKTDPISQVTDGTVTWYCIGEYTPNEGQSSIDTYGIHSPMTFKHHSSSVLREFYAGYPQNAGALWGWRQADELFTMQPGPAAHVLTWGNSVYGDPTQPNHPFAVTTSDLVFADDVGAGRFDILWPFFIGNPYGAARIKMYVDTVPPDDGGSDWNGEYWGKGSIVWNKNADNSTLGWVCTANGTPGTWAAMTISVDTSDFAGKSVVNTFTKNQDNTEVDLGSISATTVTPDSSASSQFKASLTGACTLGVPTGSPTAGRSMQIAFTNATGTATLDVSNSAFKWPGGTEPVLTAVSGARDIFTFRYNGASWDCIAVQAMS